MASIVGTLCPLGAPSSIGANGLDMVPKKSKDIELRDMLLTCTSYTGPSAIGKVKAKPPKNRMTEIKTGESNLKENSPAMHSRVRDH